eukprot:3885535-Amphidinium_carterae.1
MLQDACRALASILSGTPAQVTAATRQTPCKPTKNNAHSDRWFCALADWKMQIQEDTVLYCLILILRLSTSVSHRHVPLAKLRLVSLSSSQPLGL